jgi:hypothetical protein
MSSDIYFTIHNFSKVLFIYKITRTNVRNVKSYNEKAKLEIFLFH